MDEELDRQGVKLENYVQVGSGGVTRIAKLRGIKMPELCSTPTYSFKPYA